MFFFVFAFKNQELSFKHKLALPYKLNRISSAFPLMFLHRLSIVTPSLVRRNDGLTME